MTDADRVAVALSLRRDEGRRLTPYRDTKGILTIGYGHNLDGGISDAAAEFLLDEDITAHAADLEAAYPWVLALDPVRYRVLVQMVFNMGLSTFAQFTHTLACVQRHDFDGAADGLLQSLWASQVKGRAVRLAHEMRTGVA